MSKTSDSLTRAAMRKVDAYTRLTAHVGDVSECIDANECALYLLRKNYLRKLAPSDKRSSSERFDKTMAVWLAAEKRCYQTNQMLGNLSDFHPAASFLRAVGERIRTVIGDAPPHSLLQQGRWSNGATALTKRGTHHSVKQSGPIAVTMAASRHVPWFFRGLAEDFDIHGENRGVTVPKSLDVDRMIACEPAGNAFMQQAVHKFLRHRIKRHGVADLDDQTLNQDGAFRALVDELATLDLSSASDTVCIELVRWVLPPAWYSFLDDLRSPRMRIHDRVFLLEKFSSMGNAFTFELETLIFWAIASTIDSEFNPIVYGDDIIVRQSFAHSVIHALEFCGFLINREKSYTEGRFFESCGKYYFDLEDVTPPFQKEEVCDVWAAMRAHNRLIRWGQRTHNDSIAQSIAAIYRTAYPDFQDCLVPYGAELDNGWLTPHAALRTTKSGDFVCTVLKSKATYLYDSIEDEAYRYKLFASSHQNEHPKGYSCSPRSRETELRVRCVVWLANCQ